MGFGGGEGSRKKNGLKGGPSQKTKGGKGGHAKDFRLCTVDMMFYY